MGFGDVWHTLIPHRESDQLMPYQIFLDTSTGNNVEAVECGHDGMLVDEMFSPFSEGDYMVKHPIDLEGNRVVQHFNKDEFTKRFRSTQSNQQYWAQFGWRT
jgi:hypothetical protein